MSRVANINIKNDLQSSDIALFELESKIKDCQLEGIRVLKVVHGYGSSGKGGIIRNNVRQLLKVLQKKGEIVAFIPGELWIPSKINEYDLEDIPELYVDSERTTLNSGATVIIISKK